MIGSKRIPVLSKFTYEENHEKKIFVYEQKKEQCILSSHIPFDLNDLRSTYRCRLFLSHVNLFGNVECDRDRPMIAPTRQATTSFMRCT